MTAQFREHLKYNGKEYGMAAEPLYPYLKSNGIEFESMTSACWRGYFGKWEIKNNKLFLVDLVAFIEGYKDVGLEYLFQGQNEVFAEWFNGELRIPQGEMLQYIHMGYASIYEEDLFLDIQNGVLMSSRIVDNRGKSGIDEIPKFVDDV